jgi:hypothetical protein
MATVRSIRQRNCAIIAARLTLLKQPFVFGGVGQRVLVERVQEGRIRVGQKMLQRAPTNHCASVGIAIEAFDDRHVGF